MWVAVYDAQYGNVRAQGMDQIQELEGREIGISFALENCQSIVPTKVEQNSP